jgi:hypothetical protein
MMCYYKYYLRRNCLHVAPFCTLSVGDFTQYVKERNKMKHYFHSTWEMNNIAAFLYSVPLQHTNSFTSIFVFLI